MSRFQFDIATADDDAGLRSLLARTPMSGAISLRLLREPSFFAAAAVEGETVQVIAARDLQSRAIVGCGSRSVADRYVNGRPEPVGYLSSLRVLPEHRHGALVARGFGFLRQLHADNRARLYLTTIAAGNQAALATLTSARAGLPRYHAGGDYHTLAIPFTARPRGPQRGDGIELRLAEAGDVPAILEFFERYGARRQFFPCYRQEDFFSAAGRLRDLRPADLWLARRAGRVVGTLGGWDQHGFRQTVVEGYTGPMRWARPVYNGWARWRGRPRLPAPREPLRYLVAVAPVVADDEPAVFAALLRTLLAHRAGGPAQHLLLGLHESDPLLRVARPLAATRYVTKLFLVCWEDGESLLTQLDGRPPYLELGCL